MALDLNANLIGGAGIGGGQPMQRVAGVDNPAVAPELPGGVAAPPAQPGDLNQMVPAFIAEPPLVNIDAVSLPAGQLDRAAVSHVVAANNELRGGNIGGAVADLQAAAADYEKAADLLIAMLNGGNPAGGGTPAPTPAPAPNPVGGGTPPQPPAPALPAPPPPPAPPAPPPPAATGTNSPWTVKTNTLDPAKGSWSSVGDPHETTGDGLHFENQKTGKFDLIQSASGDFRVQNDQGPDATGRWPGMTLNHAVAVKDGNDAVSFNIDGQLNVNGQIVPVPANGQTINLPGGGTITGTPDGLTITSSKGDTVNVHKMDGYLNLDGHVGPNRKDGEVRGALGEFHDENDVNRDFKGRTGDDIIGKPDDQGATDKFEEEWRAKDDIFPKVTSTDPSGGGAPSTSSSPAWTVKTNPLTANNTFASVGDPHETTGDGLHFDNEKTGQFTLLQSATGDLVVQNEQGPDQSGRWPGATLNHKVAIKDGNDIVKYETGGALTINGQPTQIADGQTIQLPGGGSVTKNGNNIQVTTSKHDQINIAQQDQYLDITGTLGDRKDGEVRGGLGEFHMEADQNRDLKGPTGDDVIGLPGDPGAIDKFEEAWRVQGGSLFDAPAGGGAAAPDPAGGGTPPAQTGGPDPAGGGDPGQQLDNDRILEMQRNIRAAIAELNKAGRAHTRAARQLLRTGDRAGAAKEFAAASADYEKAAQLLQKWPQQAATPAPAAGGNDPAGGGAPPAGGTPIPPPNPAPLPVHARRVHRHHHRGFFHRLARIAGRVERAFLRTPGMIFNPLAAPLVMTAQATRLAATAMERR